MVKKFFISVGMEGRSERDIHLDMSRACYKLIEMYDEPIHIMRSDICVCLDRSIKLSYLSAAIAKLSGCDVCYFVKGWQNDEDCKVVYEICKLYGIRIMEEC